uniref:DDB1- and CUL4-associated factor 10-like n=1 Tax=Saccoglossus kowalevskii TaxID=10224 RepID=A0ABM0GTT4_SACKO|nr:PREDICTED: DDB1- and CUL4-associated factor 10-like [Saccoglossus kowalevskii]
MAKKPITPWNWLRERELGLNNRRVDRRRQENELVAKFYSIMSPVKCIGSALYTTVEGHGSIFNIEFSPDGKVLVAACERKSIKVCDPLTGTHITTIKDAHDDCVNLVKFLDHRLFATCSDDKTVALWDVRNLKRKIRSLRGHQSWVKNIEYCPVSNILVTSGFDGNILSWDINRYQEKNICQSKKLFHMDGLMRSRLTPDSSKLIISNSAGFIVIVHDLDLSTLDRDLHGVDPIEYYQLWVDSKNKELEDYYREYSRYFGARKNRVEIVTEFPLQSQVFNISSLQIHPYGWCALSRFTSEAEDVEYSCVHDLQDKRFSNKDETETEATCTTGVSRLTNYIEECSDGKGYIKELCFSPDGRIVCSPYGYGVRLLAFNDKCQELCDCHPNTPQELYELKTIVCHRRTVLTSKFSPMHNLLATGCQAGRIVIHQPKLI